MAGDFKSLLITQVAGDNINFFSYFKKENNKSQRVTIFLVVLVNHGLWKHICFSNDRTEFKEVDESLNKFNLLLLCILL